LALARNCCGGKRLALAFAVPIGRERSNGVEGFATGATILD
jgi:hypothetical protein